jgi:hypothetical protein
VSKYSSSALQLLRTDDFTGGLNLRANAFQLAPNESPDLLNVDIDPRGGFTSRAGCGAVHGAALGVDPEQGDVFTPTQVVRLHTWGQYLVGSTDTSQIIYIDEWGQNFSVGTDLDLGVYMEYGAGFAQFYTNDSYNGDNLFICTDGGGYLFDGTALTISGAGQWQNDLSTPNGEHMPAAYHICSHIDRMWVASVWEDGTPYPNRLRFSHPLFPKSWREEDYIDIVDGGEGITGIVSYNGNLVVFKERGVFLLSGYSTETFQLIPISLKMGCVNPLGFTEFEGRLFFFDGANGLLEFDGVRMANVSTAIWPIFEPPIDFATGSIRVWSGGRKLYLSDIGRKLTFVYDPTLGRGGAWTKYELADGECLAHGVAWKDSSDLRVAFCHPSQGHIFAFDKQLSTDDWDGDPHEFASYYTTRWQDAGNVSVKKRWRRVDMICKQPSNSYPGDYNIDVKALYDWQEGVIRRSSLATVKASAVENPFVWGGNWGEGNWGQLVEGAQYVRSSPLGPARAVQLKVVGPRGVPWGVDSLTYKFNYRRLRS